MGTVTFTKVKPCLTSVAIVGTGPSLEEAGYDFPKGLAVIAVNSAIQFLHKPRFWFTLDPSAINRAFMRHRLAGTMYYAAVPENYGTTAAETLLMQKPPDYGVRYLKRITGEGHGRYRTMGGLARNSDEIHTGNSAWGALQLAVHMGARKIGLFGIDGHGGYLHKTGRPLNLSMMPELFASGAEECRERGIEVYNASINSLVWCFPKAPAEEVKTWLVSSK